MDSEKEDHRGHGMPSAGSPSQVDSAGQPPGVVLIGVHFRPPQATRQGWPYERRGVRAAWGAASRGGPPLAGGLPGARTGWSERLWGWPYSRRAARGAGGAVVYSRATPGGWPALPGRI